MKTNLFRAILLAFMSITLLVSCDKDNTITGDDNPLVNTTWETSADNDGGEFVQRLQFEAEEMALSIVKYDMSVVILRQAYTYDKEANEISYVNPQTNEKVIINLEGETLVIGNDEYQKVENITYPVEVEAPKSIANTTWEVTMVEESEPTTIRLQFNETEIAITAVEPDFNEVVGRGTYTYSDNQVLIIPSDSDEGVEITAIEVIRYY